MARQIIVLALVFAAIVGYASAVPAVTTPAAGAGEAPAAGATPGAASSPVAAAVGAAVSGPLGSGLGSTAPSPGGAASGASSIQFSAIVGIGAAVIGSSFLF